MYNNTNQMTMCTKYKAIENEAIGIYHNAMSSVMNKPINCKNCIHYTSRSCNQSSKGFNDEGYHFFC